MQKPIGSIITTGMSNICIGIDLGTSNSCVAYCATPNPEVLSNHLGERTTPSVVTFARTGKVVVGAAAWRQAVMNPTRTISAVKRLVGRRFNTDAVTSLAASLPYEVVSAPNGDAWIQIDDRTVSPQEVQAYILEELRASASAFIGQKVNAAVITVPSFFDEIQRQAVRDAAHIAGIANARIITEPTAAALAYGYAQFDRQKIAIVDFGGGTLDVTVMHVDEGRFTVLASDGDLTLGGHDFDRAIADKWANEIQSLYGADPRLDPVATQRLIAEAEMAKRTLTTQSEVTISLPFLMQKDGKNIDFNARLTAEEFAEITQPLVERMVAPCTRALSDAGLRASEMDDVILVGGMTRAPVVQKRIVELFQRQPKCRVNPDEVVALGAALLAAGPEKRDDISFIDVAPRGLGIRTHGDSCTPLIRKSTQLPCSVSKGFATTEDNQQTFEIEILQGEDAQASKNTSLARFFVEPIPRAPAGEVKLRVNFTLGAEAGLQVNAQIIGSKDEIKVRVEPRSGLPPSDIARLFAERAQRRGDPSEAEAETQQKAPEPTPSTNGADSTFSQRSSIKQPPAMPPPPSAAPGGQRPNSSPAQAVQASSGLGQNAPRPPGSAKITPKLPVAPHRSTGNMLSAAKPAVVQPKANAKPLPPRNANSNVASGTPVPELIVGAPATELSRAEEPTAVSTRSKEKKVVAPSGTSAVGESKLPIVALIAVPALTALLVFLWFLFS